MDGIHPRGQAPRHSPSLSVEDDEVELREGDTLILSAPSEGDFEAVEMMGDTEFDPEAVEDTDEFETVAIELDSDDEDVEDGVVGEIGWEDGEDDDFINVVDADAEE